MSLDAATLNGVQPASAPLSVLHRTQATTMLPGALRPPSATGCTWSSTNLVTSSRDQKPQYRQHRPSRAQEARLIGSGMLRRPSTRMTSPDSIDRTVTAEFRGLVDILGFHFQVPKRYNGARVLDHLGTYSARRRKARGRVRFASQVALADLPRRALLRYHARRAGYGIGSGSCTRRELHGVHAARRLRGSNAKPGARLIGMMWSTQSAAPPQMRHV